MYFIHCLFVCFWRTQKIFSSGWQMAELQENLKNTYLEKTREIPFIFKVYEKMYIYFFTYAIMNAKFTDLAHAF